MEEKYSQRVDIGGMTQIELTREKLISICLVIFKVNLILYGDPFSIGMASLANNYSSRDVIKCK